MNVEKIEELNKIITETRPVLTKNGYKIAEIREINVNITEIHIKKTEKSAK